MYQINKNKNDIYKLRQCTFSELGFKERDHLQEWIAKTPNIFGEELLIIQKEFSGWDDTKERLDLLALDKQGCLVVIENKLDDSGKNTVWQSQKYASYCASLTTVQIKEVFQEYLDKYCEASRADEELKTFYGDEFENIIFNPIATQRLILVAGEFRKEITSTVLWLMNFNLKIQCFKVTPYEKGDDLFLSVDKVLPVKEVEDLTISMAAKVQEENAAKETRTKRHYVRDLFWRSFLETVNKKHDIYSGHSVPRDACNWIGAGFGFGGASVNLVLNRETCRVEIYVNSGDRDKNKRIFDAFKMFQNEIENDYGSPLVWQRLDDKNTARIYIGIDNVDYYNEEDGPKIMDFFIKNSKKMVDVFSRKISDVKKELALINE